MMNTRLRYELDISMQMLRQQSLFEWKTRMKNIENFCSRRYRNFHRRATDFSLILSLSVASAYTHTSLRSTFRFLLSIRKKKSEKFLPERMRLEMSIAIRRMMSKVESALWNWNDVCGHGNSTAMDIGSKFVFWSLDVVKISTSLWRIQRVGQLSF